MYKKGIAANLTLDGGESGLTFNMYLSNDGAAYGVALNGRVTGLGNRLYGISLTSGEMNYDHIHVMVESTETTPRRFVAIVDTFPDLAESSDIPTPPAAGDIATAVWATSNKVITSVTSAVNINSNSDVTAIKTKTDQLLFTGTDVRATLDGESVVLSSATHSGAVIPTVTNITNDVGITQGAADKIWLTASRSLTTFGSLVTDITSGVWAYGTRTLSSFGNLVIDAAAAVWGTVSKIVTSVSEPVSASVISITTDAISAVSISSGAVAKIQSGLATSGQSVDILAAIAQIDTAIGPGGTLYTYEVFDQDGDPLAGATVWVTLDLAGGTLLAGPQTTDILGKVHFMLDAGTYYFWTTKSGFTFTNPDTEVVA